MLYILNLLLLLFLLSDAGHSLLARETLRVSGLSTLADQYTSAIVSSNSAYNESQAAYSTSTSGHQSVSFTNVPTPLPYPLGSYDPGGLQNWQDLESGNCAVQDQFCSYEGFNEISGNASISAFADQCLLWDTSCVGNRTLAIEEFFNTTEGGILNNLCFSNFDSGNAGIALPEVPAASEPGQLVLEDAANSSDCKNYNPPERLSAWKKIKSWMRSPGCVSAQEEWVKMGGIAYENSSNASSCCEACVVAAQNVDLYYWPQPDVNTSCLSTIGNTVHPLGFGATTAGLDITTAGLDIYWACTAKTPVTSTYTWAGINAADVLATTTTVSMITTATLTIIGSIFVKAPLLDPWASSPCVEVDTTPRGSNGSNDSAEIQARYAPIQPRDHSLVIPSPITQEENMTVSTVVIGNFTL